jgi:hypothetical protein
MRKSLRNRTPHFQIYVGPFLFILLVLLTFVSISSCAQEPQEFGFIEGHVTIGPLVPVVREGESEPTPSPEVYASREIVIYKDDGKTEFCRLSIDSLGNYSGKLPIGVYIVDIIRIGVDSAANLPMEVRIAAGGVKTVDIDIDTGIR